MPDDLVANAPDLAKPELKGVRSRLVDRDEEQKAIAPGSPL